MIKPADFDENKQYPLFMCQYSGPGSQQVSNSFSGFDDFWYYMLAQKGYIILWCGWSWYRNTKGQPSRNVLTNN